MKNPPVHERYGLTLRDARQHLKLAARQYGKQMQEQHLAAHLRVADGSPFRVLRSREFLAQIYNENGHVRISVCRTELDSEGYWKDGISWEELQRIKNECGFADQCAVEVYPPESDVVNVANMRHLWILPEPPAFAWRAKEAR